MQSVRVGYFGTKWRWIIAFADFKKWDLIETCEVIVLPSSQLGFLQKTELYNYYFKRQNYWAAIVLWYGSLYNHSYEPNAWYEKDFVNNQVHFVALHDIHHGEEITVNYNGDPYCHKKIWFDAN